MHFGRPGGQICEPARKGLPTSAPHHPPFLPQDGRERGREGRRVYVVLRQACPLGYQRAQCAFKDSMIHWGLRFTLRIAVRRVLHRCESRGIHRQKLFYVFTLGCLYFAYMLTVVFGSFRAVGPATRAGPSARHTILGSGEGFDPPPRSVPVSHRAPARPGPCGPL